MSKNEQVKGQLLDNTLPFDMDSLNFSDDVDQESDEIFADGKLAWSKRFLTFSNPNLPFENEPFAAANPSTSFLIDQEKNNSLSIPADTTCVDGHTIPMTELSSCSQKYRSDAILPVLPSTSCTYKNCEKVQHGLNRQSINSHLNRQTPTGASFRRDKDALDPTDILQEAIQILQSLSSDVSRSLDDIPKSIALPSVIDVYSQRTIDKSRLQDSPSSRRNIKVPAGDISTFVSPSEEILQLLAALQCRCLEYREATQDIAESIVKECLLNFSDVSIYALKDLVIWYDGLRHDFTNFKKLCFKAKGSRTGAESLSDLITDCLQTSYLRLLVEENETFLVRLKFGIYMVRVNARLLRDLKEASNRIQKLEKEVDYITRTTVGYKV